MLLPLKWVSLLFLKRKGTLSMRGSVGSEREASDFWRLPHPSPAVFRGWFIHAIWTVQRLQNRFSKCVPLIKVIYNKNSSRFGALWKDPQPSGGPASGVSPLRPSQKHPGAAFHDMASSPYLCVLLGKSLLFMRWRHCHSDPDWTA